MGGLKREGGFLKTFLNVIFWKCRRGRVEILNFEFWMLDGFLEMLAGRQRPQGGWGWQFWIFDVECGEMLLAENEIDGALRGLPEWTRGDRSISASYQFAGFPEAMVFVNQVAGLAERANHHPDIDIRWNKVHLTFSTHSAGGLTALDFQLAGEVSSLAAGGADS